MGLHARWRLIEIDAEYTIDIEVFELSPYPHAFTDHVTDEVVLLIEPHACHPER
jgi:hypothetical protein